MEDQTIVRPLPSEGNTEKLKHTDPEQDSKWWSQFCIITKTGSSFHWCLFLSLSLCHLMLLRGCDENLLHLDKLQFKIII